MYSLSLNVLYIGAQVVLSSSWGMRCRVTFARRSSPGCGRAPIAFQGLRALPDRVIQLAVQNRRPVLAGLTYHRPQGNDTLTAVRNAWQARCSSNFS